MPIHIGSASDRATPEGLRKISSVAPAASASGHPTMATARIYGKVAVNATDMALLPAPAYYAGCRRLHMIRRPVASTAVLCLVITAALAAAETFGTGVSLSETTPIDRIIARPADFEGKTVKVEGTVSAVCTHMGCWMSLVPDGAKTDANLMIKVDDGVIVFPVSAKGKRAAAQGVVQRVSGDPEGQSAAAEHAKAQGKEAPVAWQIKATGAVVF